MVLSTFFRFRHRDGNWDWLVRILYLRAVYLWDLDWYWSRNLITTNYLDLCTNVHSHFLLSHVLVDAPTPTGEFSRSRLSCFTLFLFCLCYFLRAPCRRCYYNVTILGNQCFFVFSLFFAGEASGALDWNDSRQFCAHPDFSPAFITNEFCGREVAYNFPPVFNRRENLCCFSRQFFHSDSSFITILGMAYTSLL